MVFLLILHCLPFPFSIQLKGEEIMKNVLIKFCLLLHTITATTIIILWLQYITVLYSLNILTISLRNNGGFIHSSLDGRPVLVVRQAGRQKSCCLQKFSKFCNLPSNAYNVSIHFWDRTRCTNRL